MTVGCAEHSVVQPTRLGHIDRGTEASPTTESKIVRFPQLGEGPFAIRRRVSRDSHKTYGAC